MSNQLPVVPARPAHQAHDAFGMNIHLGFQKPDNTNHFTEQTVDLLLELGVGRVRQKLYCDEGRSREATRAGLRRLMAAGVRVCAPTLVMDDATSLAAASARMEAYLDELEHNPDWYDLGMVASLPGLNEPNGLREPADWAQRTRWAQQAIHERTRARSAFDHVVVHGPPLCRPAGERRRGTGDGNAAGGPTPAGSDDAVPDAVPGPGGGRRGGGRRGGMGGGRRGLGGLGGGRRGRGRGGIGRGGIGGGMGGLGGGLGGLGGGAGRGLGRLARRLGRAGGRGDGMRRGGRLRNRPGSDDQIGGRPAGGAVPPRRSDGEGGRAGAFAARLAAHAAEVGDLSAWVDRADLHIYPGDSDSLRGGPPQVFVESVRDMYRSGKPVVVTESGWSNSSPDDPDGELYTGGGKSCPESVTAKYAPKAPLNALLLGYEAVYAYEMLENQPPYDDHGHKLRGAKFGYIRTPGLDPSTWERKAQFQAMKRFLALFADPGTAFQPAGLPLTVSGDCPDLQSMLFQRRGGAHLLALWRTVDLYSCDQQSNDGSYLQVAPVPVTVSLDAARPVQVFLPSSQEGPVTRYDQAQLSVDVGDELVVLQIG